MKLRDGLFVILAAAIIIFSVSCIKVGETREDNVTVKQENAETVKMTFKIRAGELTLYGGNNEMMEAVFVYNIDRWKPLVDYQVVGRRGELSVKQGKTKGIPVGNTKNRWEIYVGKNVPLDIEIDFGAGQGNLDLREINLKSLEIDMGVGDLDVDLRGDRIQDLNVSIDGGVGSGTIFLPRDIGVRAKVDGGIGSIEAVGLKKTNDIYTNEAYGRSDVTIDIDIEAGIGSIELIVK